MEKRVVLAMVLSVVLLMGWSALARRYAPPPAPPRTTVAPADGQGGPDAPAVPPPPPPPDGHGDASAPGAVPAPVAEDAPPTTLDVDPGRIRFRATSAGAGLQRAAVWACPVHAVDDPEAQDDPGVVSESPPGMPGFLATNLLGSDLYRRNWTLTRDGNGFVASIDDPERGVRLTKTVTPVATEADPYGIDVEIRVEGLGTGTGRALTLEVVGPATVPSSTPFPEDGVCVARPDQDLSVRHADAIVKELTANPTFEESAAGGLTWVGTRNGFHLGALGFVGPVPEGAAVGFVQGAATLHGAAQPVLVAAPTLRMPVVVPAAGQVVTLRLRAFAGPNSRPLLTAEDSPYRAYADAVVNRGFFFLRFGWISRILGWFLRVLASTGMGYGVAIVCLTVIVRGLLFPISKKSQISMRVHGKKMQLLKPRMDAIKEKIKDQRKQQEAIMKLMREEKVSPVPGGCLLAFIQMPIWISLYGVLQSTFELRHERFLWAADLTRPDHLLRLPFTDGLWIVDGWLNLFPILMMITWGISSFMAPLPDDPQQRQTAKMMRWMPMLFGVMLYNYASGLCIYMTCSAIWSIGEMQLIKRVWLAKLDL